MRTVRGEIDEQLLQRRTCSQARGRAGGDGAAMLQVRQLIALHELTMLSNKGALVKMSESFSQKSKLSAQGAEVFLNELTKAPDRLAASFQRVIAKKDKTVDQYHQVLLFVQKYVKVRKDGRNDGLDTIESYVSCTKKVGVCPL